MRKIFLMSKLNGKKQRRFTLSITLSIIFCSLLFLTVVSVSISIEKLYVSINENDIDNREIITSNIFDQTKINRLLLIPHVESHKIKYVAQSLSYSLEERYEFVVTAGDITFEQTSMVAVDLNGQIFTEAEILTDNEGEYVEPIVAGRTLQKGDKKAALISEVYIYLLGYKSPEEIVGQKIEISLDGKTVDNIEIVGVYHRSLNGLGKINGDALYDDIIHYLEQKAFYEEHGFDTSGLDEMIERLLDIIYGRTFILSDDTLFEIVEGHIAEEEMWQGIYLYADSIYNVKAICEEVDSVAHHYSSEMDFIETVKETVQDIQAAGISISSVMLFVTLVSLVCFIIIRINEQEKLSQLMIRMGYNSKDITLIYITETMRFVIKALLIALLSATVLSIALDIVLQPTYEQMGESVRFMFLINPWLLMIYFAGVSLITLGLIYLTVKGQLRKNRIV